MLHVHFATVGYVCLKHWLIVRFLQRDPKVYRVVHALKPTKIVLYCGRTTKWFSYYSHINPPKVSEGDGNHDAQKVRSCSKTWKGWTLPITWEERTRVTRGQHKGWHRLFYYVLGTSLVDMHIIHKETMKRRGTPKGGHERYGLPKTSSLNLDQEVEPNMGNMPTEKWTHVPMRSKLRWKCVLCRRRCNNICNHDGGLHMCLFTLLIAKSTHPVRLDSVSSHQWHFMTFIL